MVLDPATGKYRRTRLFVMTLGCSRKSVRLLTFRSSARIWAELHERAFRRLGGATRIVVLDFVPGNKIEVLWRAALCGRSGKNQRRLELSGDRWAHNNVASVHHGLPFGTSERRLTPWATGRTYERCGFSQRVGRANPPLRGL
jgi:hypothetical protein